MDDTLIAALDPRISESFPIAGSIPLTFEHKSWDFEQKPRAGAQEWYLDAANYTTLYALAALEPHRHSLQILHEDDPCCYYGRGRHAGIQEYVADVGSRYGIEGAFGTAVTDWNVHAICEMDRLVMQTALANVQSGSPTPFDALPCDIILQEAAPACPYPPPTGSAAERSGSS